MPELMALVFNYVDPLTRPCCRAVSRHWSAIFDLCREFCARLAAEGRLAVLEWARTNGCPWDYRTCASAARRGDLALLQRLRADGCPWDKSTTSAAAAAGQLDVLKWALANGCLLAEPMICNETAAAGQLAWTCAKAAQGGHLELLQWARANGCPWDQMTCALAAEGGHMEVLQWARDNGGRGPAAVRETNGRQRWRPAAATLRSYSGSTPMAARGTPKPVHRRPRGGHLDILQWARANGCLWDEKTCARPAGGAPWASANGCPWGRQTWANMIKRGDADMVRWARDHSGQPWDAQASCAAAARGDLGLLEAYAENGPWDEEICLAATRGGHLEVVQWLRAKGCPWSPHTCTHAALKGHLEVVKWARANGCPWRADTIRLTRRRQRVLAWAAENGLALDA
ncbi:uncharacterized protein ACA1_351310 [Acanthamoeba castellanii str. Neff]|uniref:F-box domain-containing protein n=1 Tax=Acanthamoeba castellanii (strain ATCC 30010 / Neff) TaxID=1257118 RepID=L8GEI6_ACACF|nr:uncharacterized protein ACA1_351310 [Acanthamoeba castellanii str. Neff]ELR11103.1 hypothetical protein ACA1_351310 [Acanthamoeba castellanii str. Neff]